MEPINHKLDGQKNHEIIENKKPLETEGNKFRIEMEEKPQMNLKTKEDDEEEKRLEKVRKFEEEKKRKEIEERRRKEDDEEKRRLKDQEEKRHLKDEEEKKRREKEKEKERLEEEERRKRWITTNPNLNTPEEKEKISAEQSKKAELLAKLALLDSPETKPAPKPTTYNQPAKIEIQLLNENPSPKAPNQPSNTTNSTYNALFNPNTLNTNTAPVKINSGHTNKSYQSNHINHNQADYKHSQPIENLHEGKPVQFPRDISVLKDTKNDNKNELLSKLFGDSDNLFNKPQGKVNNKNDDLFSSSKPPIPASNKNTNSTSNATKGTVLPWETVESKNKPKSPFGNSTNFDSMKNDHADFFSKLNSNTTKTSPPINNGMNRPKMDNNLLFSPTQNKSNNFVEDIEELIL